MVLCLLIHVRVHILMQYICFCHSSINFGLCVERNLQGCVIYNGSKVLEQIHVVFHFLY